MLDSFIFEPIEFVNNLKYMGIGMLGVFMIVGVIMAATYAIGAITARIEEARDKNESAE